MEQQEFYKHLGARIRHVRTNVRDISQAEFASRVALSRPSIVNIEKGRQHVSSYQLVLFAIALGISPIQLLEEEKIEENSELSLDSNDELVPDHLQNWYKNAQ